MIRNLLAISGALFLLLGLAPVQAGEAGIEVVFTRDEIRIISAYYHNHTHYQRGGKSKHKRKGLPPGIAKNLARGKPLPPGIAKQALPNGLIDALPPVPRGHERIIVDGKVLLVEIATQIVRDVLTQAILG